jgi:hypothetical protein
MPTVTTRDGAEIFYKDWGEAGARGSRPAAAPAHGATVPPRRW